MASANSQAVEFVKQRAEQRFTHWHNQVEKKTIAALIESIGKCHWWQFKKKRNLKNELFGAVMIQQTIKGAINEIRLLR
jgi:endonuclease III-like uncharacterized protein